MKDIHPSHNIYIVGPMGAGKTQTAKHLARLTKRPYIDIDQEIEKRCGVAIGWIFDVEGEAGFRERETTVLKELSLQKNMILATGGGTVLSDVNRSILSTNGTIVYLTISLDTQTERLSRRTSQRPLTRNITTPEQLRTLNAARIPHYENLADLSFNTDYKRPYDIARAILSHYPILKNKP